ncbi:GH39 family glycosyl hydrolase [Sediminitomix flava]|uniref:Glycosyl hydrolase family 39 n=1 Tax=Sediminitomix flava TaxID=379075 RepID=A0A315Z5B0_SEDFL|nr:hypothetical protein [Sediminitomix flava]PWJ37942.1 glycosyl hydrolase family 39 [Sediminitomix flava]
MKKLILLFLLLTNASMLIGQELTVEKAKVSFSPDQVLSYNGVKNFDRQKYINIHSSYRSIPNSFKDYLYKDLKISDGRRFGLGGPSNKASKTNHKIPGAFSYEDLQEEMKRTIKNSDPELPFKSQMIFTSHPGSFFPVGNFKMKKDGVWQEGYEAIANYFVERLKEPALQDGYLELLNEPFVHDRDMHTSIDTIVNMMNTTAKVLHQTYPELKIGGPGHAWPAYELQDFKVWEDRMSKFIERAGKEMDFLSVHLYSTFYDDKVSYRAGANAEAILDLIEAKSFKEFGKVKPLVISEYGAGFKAGSKIQEAYFQNRDWLIIHSVNSKMMQFMQRPDRIQKTIPFITSTATWFKSEHPYPYVLFHKKGNDWETTHLIKFYEFWKGIEGEYIPVNSSHPDVQVIGLRNNNKFYICLDNLEDKETKVDLFSTLKGFKAKKVRIRRLFSNSEQPVLEEIKLKNWKELTLKADETSIIIFELKKELQNNKEIVLTEKYHENLIEKVDEDGISYDFEVNTKGLTHAELSLGISRPINLSTTPVVSVNGYQLMVDENEMGRRQDFKELTFEGAEEPKKKRPKQQNFFGVRKVAIPLGYLKEQNTITVKFEEGEGFVSTIKLSTAHLRTLIE